MKGGPFIFGCVVVADPGMSFTPCPGRNLLYFYDHRGKSADPNIELLNPNRLLIPPVWTNRRGWTMGYYRTIGRRRLLRSDYATQHCFSDSFFKRYVDERGSRLSRRTEPCGIWGIASYRWIDDRISEALGIALAPDDERD